MHGAAKRVGIVWRAALALIELDATPGGDRSREHLHEAAELVREKTFRSRSSRGASTAGPRLVATAWSPSCPRRSERCCGTVLAAKSQKEIASAMNLSAGTVHNYVTRLLENLRVHSTAELIVGCYERGIGSPSWWDDLERRPV